MRECKILDLAKPFLRTWSSGSNLESITLLQENALEWIFDNYVNLMGYLHYQGKSGGLSFIPRHYPSSTDMTI